MTPQDWAEAAERYRKRVVELEANANFALDAGLRGAAYLLFGSAKEYEDAAIDAERKAMEIAQ